MINKTTEYVAIEILPDDALLLTSLDTIEEDGVVIAQVQNKRRVNKDEDLKDFPRRIEKVAKALWKE